MSKKKLSIDFSEILFCAVAAVILIMLQTVICIYTEVNPYISGSFICILYVVCLWTFTVIKKNITNFKSSSPLPETMNVLADAVTNLPTPVVLCRGGSDKIIWYNSAALQLFGKKNVSFSELFTTVEDSEGKMRLSAGDRIFEPETFTSEGKSGKEYNVFILNDVTDSDRKTKELLGKRCAVAYITVDNLEELLNYEQEDYRNASGEAESILRRFATEHGGVLKEYQQDKFIFLFEMSHIKEFINNGFDILEKIRNISVGDSDIPVTISMGLSVDGETLQDREKEAQTALKTALQRGGDQAVIRMNGELTIFGGKTKMQQKRTTVKARVVAEELSALIKNSSNVLIMGHRFADFDAFGASVGVAVLCRLLGVKANIISDLDDSNLDRCRAWISSEKAYNGIFVDRDGAMDMIEPDTLLVVVDVNNTAQFETSAVAENCDRVVIVDHHRKTADKIDYKPIISYIEPSASAASELVAEMLEQTLPSGYLTAKEADLMMAGILLDTNHFTKNTGTRTFSAALYLRSCGADVGEVQEFFKTELDDFQRELKFHENVEIYRGITAIAIPAGECSLKDKVPAAKAADKLLGVEGVRASFALVPIGDEVHISARSTGKINVQLLLEKLNGGGHFDSAGTRLGATNIEKAVELLKNSIDEYFDEKNIKAGEKSDDKN